MALIIDFYLNFPPLHILNNKFLYIIQQQSYFSFFAASGIQVVELRPQNQHLNLLPAITVAHFSNNSGFELRCENPFSNHEVVSFKVYKNNLKCPFLKGCACHLYFFHKNH